MTEKVSTGGAMKFEYERGHAPKMSQEEKKEIENAYKKYYDRKTREKKKKNILIAIAIIITLIILITILLKNL